MIILQFAIYGRNKQVQSGRYLVDICTSLGYHICPEYVVHQNRKIPGTSLQSIATAAAQACQYQFCFPTFLTSTMWGPGQGQGETGIGNMHSGEKALQTCTVAHCGLPQPEYWNKHCLEAQQSTWLGIFVKP